MRMLDLVTWHADWAWSLPLIVLTIVIHVLGLGLMNRGIDRVVDVAHPGRQSPLRFIVTLVFVSIASTCLLAMAVFTWAIVYVFLGALADGKAAMLYSLSALTSYGHVPIYLEPQWQLMGALESLNGMILLGLTTAFMFSIIQRLRPIDSGQ